MAPWMIVRSWPGCTAATIRASVARDIAARMEYQGRSVVEATGAALDKVKQLGGNGGVIAIDREGRISMDFNSPGMYRAYKIADRPTVVAIYDDEPRR